MTMRQTIWQQIRGDFPLWCLRVFLAMLVITLVTIVNAEVSPLIRRIHLATLLLGLFTALWYLGRANRRRPRALIPAVTTAILLFTWAFTAGRPPNVAALRLEYLRRLRAFRGVPYVWGGETHTGIDCSGLARVAFLEAMLLEGAKELNPRLLGPMAWQFWWNDMSASAMGAGVYGYTRDVRSVARLDTDSHAGIAPGDLAVAKPRHVLIYLGNRQWIEATSENGVAINVAAPETVRKYYHMPMHIVRWWALDIREGRR